MNYKSGHKICINLRWGWPRTKLHCPVFVLVIKCFGGNLWTFELIIWALCIYSLYLSTHIFGDHGDFLVGDADVLGDVRQVGGEHLQAARVAQNLRVGVIFTDNFSLSIFTWISDRQRHSEGQNPPVTSDPYSPLRCRLPVELLPPTSWSAYRVLEIPKSTSRM